MVEDELSDEVEVSWLRGLELEANQAEGITKDEAIGRIGLECSSRVLKHFVVNWCLGSIVDLHSLIN